MTINWKQGLFAAVTLLSLTLFVGCDKAKSDKALADKAGDKTAEVVEEVDVIEIAPVKPEEKAAPKTDSSAPDLTAPETPTPAPAPTEEPAASVPTSTITSSEMSSSTAEESNESESVFGHRRRGCAVVSVCSPCEPVCAPAPICAPAPVCTPCVPACEPACASCCDSCCKPCRVTCKERRMTRRAARACWNPCTPACVPACGPCVAACEPACAPASDCPNGDCSGSWSTETENAAPAELPTPKEDNKQVSMPVPNATSEIRTAVPASVIGTDTGKPEAPAIALPEAK